MKKSSFTIIVTVIFVGLVAAVLTYIYFPEKEIQIQEQEFVLEIFHGGGNVDNSVEIVNAYHLNPDGELVGVSRNGEIAFTRNVSKTDLDYIQESIDTLSFPEDVAEKTRFLCPSSYDAPDTIITLYHSNGEKIVFSNCDWRFDFDHPFMKIIFDLTLRAESE